MKKLLKSIFKPVYNRYQFLVNKANKEDVDALYKLLYNQVHDYDKALPLATAQTTDTFGFQWSELQEGEAMLSDKWFKDNVTNIISEKETLIKKEWFKGKNIIDCGCGGGRWSYGLAQLGANITAVDINTSAIQATKDVLQNSNVEKKFVLSPLETLTEQLPVGEGYDMVWSWGVLHHCGSFNQAFLEVMKYVKEGGFIYIYLYGREGISYEEDINLFKNRVKYNTLTSWKEKEEFLIRMSHGDKTKLHQAHDIYAPLLNRRLEFDYVSKMLQDNGFVDIVRTVKSPELHIRATKGKTNEADKPMLLPSVAAEPWYSKYGV
jgi:2-polyprenyl-3-methyl-5-hydroxy-6-metoxy-1,4-benzoquinol methylase